VSAPAAGYAAASEIGFRLRWMRKRLSLSLRELETKTGVSPATISRAENGAVMEMSLGAFLSLCAALETTPSDVISAA